MEAREQQHSKGSTTKTNVALIAIKITLQTT